MRIFLQIISAILLLFNAASGIYGGIYLMIDPTGQSLGLPIEWLKLTPFTSYFIPGLLLFVVIGLSSLMVAILVIIRHKYSSNFIFYQGFISLGWIVVQLALIKQFTYQQIIYASVGLILFILAFKLLTWQNPQIAEKGT